MPRSISYSKLTEEKKVEIREKAKLYYKKNKNKISLKYNVNKKKFKEKALLNYYKNRDSISKKRKLKSRTSEFKEKQKKYIEKKLIKDPNFLKRIWKKN